MGFISSDKDGGHLRPYRRGVRLDYGCVIPFYQCIWRDEHRFMYHFIHAGYEASYVSADLKSAEIQ